VPERAGSREGAGAQRFVETALPSLLGAAARGVPFRPGLSLALRAARLLLCGRRDQQVPAWPTG
jgi:hypothetical protein